MYETKVVRQDRNKSRFVVSAWEAGEWYGKFLSRLMFGSSSVARRDATTRPDTGYLPITYYAMLSNDLIDFKQFKHSFI